jgi:hypothetical protein
MMTNDDVPRNMPYQQGRKPVPPNRYSPSPSYNYNYNTNSQYSSQQHTRKKFDRFKRDNGNLNDRIMRQNDLIIRLLKEIRDRLPPPAPVQPSAVEAETVRQNVPAAVEETERGEGVDAVERRPQDHEAPEPGNEALPQRQELAQQEAAGEELPV